jgi:hypothetical protein
VSSAGHDLRRCSVASRDDGTNDLLVDDMLRTDKLQEWR